MNGTRGNAAGARGVAGADTDPSSEAASANGGKFHDPAFQRQFAFVPRPKAVLVGLEAMGGSSLLMRFFRGLLLACLAMSAFPNGSAAGLCRSRVNPQ